MQTNFQVGIEIEVFTLWGPHFGPEKQKVGESAENEEETDMGKNKSWILEVRNSWEGSQQEL